MYKLVSDVGRWSFLNGHYVFGNVVWIGDLNDVSKYSLVDDNGNAMDFDVEKCLEKC